jgi:membrane-bound lytic murein transglycosylase A
MVRKMQKKMRIWAWLLPLCVLAACSSSQKLEHMELLPTHVDAVQGWQGDNFALALQAFVKSCKAAPPQWRDDAYRQTLPPLPNKADWKRLCLHAITASRGGDDVARHFFEQYFSPYRIVNVGGGDGLFTGYYAPVLKGARSPDAVYRYPAYRLPADAAQYTRADIDAGALNGKGLEIVWLDDFVMRFFLEIQGSGLVQLREGGMTRLQYAGKNGQPYVAIGKVLIARGEMTKEQMSMPALRQWLYDHPQQAMEVMQQNPSYVFFKEDKNTKEVIGAQGVPLTAGRSLAVDKKHIPYGLPVFLNTVIPDDVHHGVPSSPFNHLMVAQDTGGAIRGVVRGDIFFGFGAEAEQPAGVMNSAGQLTVLLPHATIP